MTTRRTKPAGAYEGKEDAFQRSAISLVRLIGMENGIDSRAIMHIPNGGQRNQVVAAKLKAQGTVAGYPDIMVFLPRFVNSTSRFLCGLAMELKAWPNKPTEEQEEVHELLRLAGWRVVVCYSLDQVEEEARRYFEG